MRPGIESGTIAPLGHSSSQVCTDYEPSALARCMTIRLATANVKGPASVEARAQPRAPASGKLAITDFDSGVKGWPSARHRRDRIAARSLPWPKAEAARDRGFTIDCSAGGQNTFSRPSERLLRNDRSRPGKVSNNARGARLTSRTERSLGASFTSLQIVPRKFQPSRAAPRTRRRLFRFVGQASMLSVS